MSTLFQKQIRDDHIFDACRSKLLCEAIRLLKGTPPPPPQKNYIFVCVPGMYITGKIQRAFRKEKSTTVIGEKK